MTTQDPGFAQEPSAPATERQERSVTERSSFSPEQMARFRHASVPGPVVLPGDVAEVFHARRKPPAWERGIVRHVVCHSSARGEWHWSYDVVLDRPSSTGRSITVVVRDSRAVR